MTNHDDLQVELDEAVSAEFDARATEINNSGIHGQIAFLRSTGWTDTELYETFDGLRDALAEH